MYFMFADLFSIANTFLHTCVMCAMSDAPKSMIKYISLDAPCIKIFLPSLISFFSLRKKQSRQLTNYIQTIDSTVEIEHNKATIINHIHY